MHPTANLAGSGLPFDINSLSTWLRKYVKGISGEIKITKFNGGQSNPTYKIQAEDKFYVMRSKPGPATQLLPSAHAIDREYAVMSALKMTNVPVPEMLAICDDESIIGRAFYIMEHMDGKIYWDQSLPSFDSSSRRQLYKAMNSVIANLHLVNPNQVGLSQFGKPGNYFERQISRWTKQYISSETDPIVEMRHLIDWLPRNIPSTARDEKLQRIVHGDFRLDNLMFMPTRPVVIALLDWELSTIGHPLADFSYHCMSWHIEPGIFRGIKGLNLETLGIPSEKEYITTYCESTNFYTPTELESEWNFYMAYNMFRLASILQGIQKRIESGTASSTQAKTSAAGARPMAQKAWSFAMRL